MAIAVGGVATSLILVNSSWWTSLLGQRSSTLDATDLAAFNLFMETFKAFVIGASVAGLLLYAFFAWKMWIGRNWARVTLTVFAAMASAGAVSTRSFSAGFWAGFESTSADKGATVASSPTIPSSLVALGWLEAIVAIAAIVLMYVRSSNRYFADAKLFRMFIRR